MDGPEFDLQSQLRCNNAKLRRMVNRQRWEVTVTDQLKSWVTNPFLKVVLWSSEVVISNNHLISQKHKTKISFHRANLTCNFARKLIRSSTILIAGFKKILDRLTSFFSFSINLSTRWEPINPAPPVTRILMLDYCQEQKKHWLNKKSWQNRII